MMTPRMPSRLAATMAAISTKAGWTFSVCAMMRGATKLPITWSMSRARTMVMPV